MLIRRATPDDASQLLTHVQRLANEQASMISLAPGEFQITIEQERMWLESYTTEDNSICIVTEDNGRISGLLNCDGGTRQATRHSASFGMSVALEERNKGIGSALLNYLIQWAKSTNILLRLELEVYEHNTPALHLYQKSNFREEGRKRRAFLHEGSFIDSLLMALWLDDAEVK
jgi:RimJ/RimL family protein N-acetyltransferase